MRCFSDLNAIWIRNLDGKNGQDWREIGEGLENMNLQIVF